MSILQASLARVFSWLPSKLRSQLCESTCSNAVADMVENISAQPKVLQPTQVIKTVIYQMVPQIEAKQSSIPVKAASNPLSLIALLTVLIIGFLLIGICIFATVHRCNAKSKRFIARVEAERDANASYLKIVTSQHNGDTTNLLQRISRLIQERDGFRAMFEQLMFTNQWLASLKADAGKHIQFQFEQLCDGIRELEAQNGLLDFRHAEQEKKHLSTIESLKAENVKANHSVALVLNDLSAQNSELESTVEQLMAQVSKLQADRKSAEGKWSLKVKELEESHTALVSDKKKLSEKYTAEVETTAARTKEIGNLQKEIGKLKYNETKLKKEKARVSERQIAAELEIRERLIEIQDLEEQQSTLVSENAKLNGELNTTSEAHTARLAEIDSLEFKCSVLENEKVDLVTEISTLTTQLSTWKSNNTKLRNSGQALIKEIKGWEDKVKSAESLRFSAQQLCSSAQSEVLTLKNTLSQKEETAKQHMRQTEESHERLANQLEETREKERILKAEISEMKDKFETLEKGKDRNVKEGSDTLNDVINGNETLKLLVRAESRNMQSHSQSLTHMSRALSEFYDKALHEALTNFAADIFPEDGSKELRTDLEGYIGAQLERARDTLEARQVRIQKVVKAMVNSTAGLLNLTKLHNDEDVSEKQAVKDLTEIEEEIDKWTAIPGEEKKTHKRRNKARGSKKKTPLPSQEHEANQ